MQRDGLSIRAEEVDAKVNGSYMHAIQKNCCYWNCTVRFSRFHNAVDLISKKFKYNTFFLNDQENAFSEIVEINLVLK